MKQKWLNSIGQNILNKKPKGNKVKDISLNLYPYSLPISYHNISDKNDELLIKKKKFNFNKNPNYITLASSYLNSIKSINKTNINLKNNILFNKPEDNSITNSKNNCIVSKSIDNSNNKSKELLISNKKDKLLSNYIFNSNFNKNKKNENISLNKIISINKDDKSFYSSTINKNDKRIPKIKLYKNKEHSITNFKTKKNFLDTKNILFNKNLDNIDNIFNQENKLIKNEIKNKNYRKSLINEKINEFKNLEKNDENLEVIEIINDDKINNKGLFYLYNHQNNIFNLKNKIKPTMKYPSFNSINNKVINNSKLYNMSNENRSLQKPMMILAPSIKTNIEPIKKNNKIKNNSLLEKNENNFYNKFFDKPNINSIQNEDINSFINKMNFSNKKNINHIPIFSKNNEIKNWNNDNISEMNINISNISNITSNLNIIKKKLKLKKAMMNNKTEFLLNNNKELDSFNKIIDKYITPSYSSKERKKINEKKYGFNNDKESENIINQVNEIISTKQISNESNMTKKESNNLSNISNIIKFSKTMDKNDCLFDNISEISKESTAIKDSKYYMDKSKKLVEYIKDYFNKNKIYPKTKINFYLYGRQIGQGAFGKVNLGLNVLTGRVVAIKSFKKSSEEKFKSNMKKVLYETNLMKNLNHPNITKILEVFNDEDYMLIIMEYINGGNLFSFVKKRRKLSEKIAKFLFRQIILGIKYIHSQNIVHRDIKLENIIIDFNNTVKICDFGIGKILRSNEELLYDKCGTPMYMAPEIVLSSKKNGYRGFPVDIWASGITLYIMLTGNLPFNLNNKSNDELSLKEIKKKDNTDLQLQIINFNPKKIKHISEEAYNLLCGLLNKNPEKRLTCDEILNHPWLKNINYNFLNNDNDKNNLFTKAEMTLMSKTYIDYRSGNLEDLRENFTITNLKCDEIREEEKNITSKSSILDPFNSAITNNNKSLINSSIEDAKDIYDDFNNSKLELENDIIIFNNKVKQYNLNYEINNNQEVDNGMMIKTKSDISSSNSNLNNSRITNNKDKEKELFEYQFNEEKNKKNKNMKYNNIMNNNLEEKNNFNDIDVNNPKDNEILNQIQKFGYNKEFVIKCIKNNILCHASTVYYLLKNYGDIE